MKPTLENLEELASRTDDRRELLVLKDHALFYLGGLKAAQDHLGAPMHEIWPLVDQARRTQEKIDDRIRNLKAE